MARADRLAIAAVEPVLSGMVVGLGTGRAASRAIDALARRARESGLEITCVATSADSERRAAGLGLRVVPMEGVVRVDYLFDGADEVDERLRMIKGRGGAMTREKIVARASARRVYLVQRSKLVPRLGQAAPLPIEVMRFGLAAVRSALDRIGLAGPLRRSGGEGASPSTEYLTDNGNPVIDAALPAHLDLAELDRRLSAVPGVVGHGLFLDEADELLIEDERGGVERRERA